MHNRATCKLDSHHCACAIRFSANEQDNNNPKHGIEMKSQDKDAALGRETPMQCPAIAQQAAGRDGCY